MAWFWRRGTIKVFGKILEIIVSRIDSRIENFFFNLKTKHIISQIVSFENN